jgi:hypothetical protein
MLAFELKELELFAFGCGGNSLEATRANWIDGSIVVWPTREGYWHLIGHRLAHGLEYEGPGVFEDLITVWSSTEETILAGGACPILAFHPGTPVSHVLPPSVVGPVIQVAHLVISINRCSRQRIGLRVDNSIQLAFLTGESVAAPWPA